jgi:membrane protein DedA with SNARE-associated domain
MVTVKHSKLLLWLKYALAATPWVVAMYLLYYLGKNDIWDTETRYRDLMTILILVLGMGLSFAVQSFFIKQNKNAKD